MTSERTELSWTYDPPDFFEAPYQHAQPDFDLLVDAGRAVATLKVPQEPVARDVEKTVRATIESVLLVRQLQVRSKYRLEGPSIHQRSAGNVSILVRDVGLVITEARVDLIEADAAGNIVRDSRAERIAEHSSMLDSVAPKLVRSPILRSLCESYSRSVADPANELVHLYEVRDALVKYYGGKRSARDALAISETQWGRLGVLANVAPLEEGRHRGKHPAGRRAATESELAEARQLALSWILAFAKAV